MMSLSSPKPSISPLRTGQARLFACHVAAVRLHDADWWERPEALQRDIRTVLEDTIRALSDLVLERDAATGPTFEARTTGEFSALLEEMHAAADPVGDLAFVAGGQLRRKLGELQGITAAMRAGSPMLLADVCGSCLRHVIKATMTVEPALAAAHGLAPRLTRDPQRDPSLDVRRAYTTFRRAVLAVDGHERRALVATAEALQALMVAPAFRATRPADRHELESLAARVRAALDGPAESLEVPRVLGDLRGVASMLGAIGRREVLIVHDLRALPEVLGVITTLMAAGRPVLRGHLEPVRGLDDTVEAMLEPGQPIDEPRLVAELQRVLQERRQLAGLVS